MEDRYTKSRTKLLYHILGTDGRVYYVGASNSPTERMRAHLIYAYKWAPIVPHGMRFFKWLHREHSEGREPRLVIARRTTGDWREAERREIKRQAKLGQPILNSNVRGWSFDVRGVNRLNGRLCILNGNEARFKKIAATHLAHQKPKSRKAAGSVRLTGRREGIGRRVKDDPHHPGAKS